MHCDPGRASRPSSQAFPLFSLPSTGHGKEASPCLRMQRCLGPFAVPQPTPSIFSGEESGSNHQGKQFGTRLPTKDFPGQHQNRQQFPCFSGQELLAPCEERMGATWIPHCTPRTWLAKNVDLCIKHLFGQQRTSLHDLHPDGAVGALLPPPPFWLHLCRPSPPAKCLFCNQPKGITRGWLLPGFATCRQVHRERGTHLGKTHQRLKAKVYLAGRPRATEQSPGRLRPTGLGRLRHIGPRMLASHHRHGWTGDACPSKLSQH